MDLETSDPEGHEFDPLIKLSPPYFQIQIRLPALIFKVTDDFNDEMSKLPLLFLSVYTSVLWAYFHPHVKQSNKQQWHYLVSF